MSTMSHPERPAPSAVSAADAASQEEDGLFLTTSALPKVRTANAVDWEALTTQARIAMTKAYVPYSKYPVGAAALLTDGSVISGCNVENASYGLTLCAECTLVGQLQMNGGGKIAAFTCVNREAEYITPCGRCRQLLHEFAAPTLHIRTAAGITSLEKLLPESFGPDDLES